MAQLEKIKPSASSRWPYNLKIDTIISDEMREWLIEAHGHADVYNDEMTESWFSSESEEPAEHVDIVYFFWGPGYIQFKHEEDMVAFVLRFSG